MTLFHLFLVATIQGITEFLPISSSGHLILLPGLTGWQDQGLVIDVAVHVGTLARWCSISGRRRKAPRVRASLPAGAATRRGAAGAVAGRATVPVSSRARRSKLTGLDDALRSTAVIGWTMLGFGLVLYWADQKGPDPHGRRLVPAPRARHGFVAGVALIPGTSRSGITITGARLLGYERSEAARLSMLMSIPTIMASGLLLGGGGRAAADAGPPATRPSRRYGLCRRAAALA